MKQPISLNDHFELSEKIHDIRSLLEEVRTCIQNKSGCSSEMRKITVIENHINGLRGGLDTKYHKIIDDNTFKKLGHIYYGGKQHESTG